MAELSKMGKILELAPKIGVRLCNAAIIFFLVAFLFSALCSWAGPLVPNLFTGLRFPLAGLTGIAVDDENIYTISRGYGRFQVFDKTGKFVRGWFCPFSKGAVWINVNKDDNLSVILSTGKEYIYTVDGKLLGKSDRSEEYPDENTRQGKNETYDSEGNLYAPIDSFHSRIIKFSPSGNMSTVVSDPTWVCIVKVPFNLIILAALVVPRSYFQKCRMNQKKHGIPNKAVSAQNSAHG